MRLPEQLRRSPSYDIRLCVHNGMDFDMHGHFTPLFKGTVYIMVPRWANISSIDDLKKVKINVGGQEIDFSNLDLSRIDTSKLKFQSNEKEQPKVEPENKVPKPNESKSRFGLWFGTASTLPSPSSSESSTPSVPSPPPSKSPVEPATRNFL